MDSPATETPTGVTSLRFDFINNEGHHAMSSVFGGSQNGMAFGMPRYGSQSSPFFASNNEEIETMDEEASNRSISSTVAVAPARGAHSRFQGSRSLFCGDAETDSTQQARSGCRKRKNYHESKRTKNQAESKNPPSLECDEDDRKPAPAAAAAAAPAAKLKSTGEDDNDDGNCIICLCEPDDDDLAKINGCDHQFCFECIEKWSERENTCPLCKERFTEIDRVNERKRQRADDSDEEKKSSKKVKNRDQRADLHPSHALEGLLANLGAASFFPPHIARLMMASNDDLGASPRRAGGPRRSVSLRLRREGNGSTSSLSANFSIDDNSSEDSNRTRASNDEDHYRAFVNRMRVLRSNRVGVPVLGAFPMPGTRTAPVGIPLSRITRGGPFALANHLMREDHFRAPSQSHATNFHDSTAGGSADNALEIADDSDDDEIEVVDVRRGHV